jgi:TonB family protein
MNSRSILAATYELKRPYQRNLAIGFGVSAMAHLIAIGTIYSIILLRPSASVIHPIVWDGSMPLPSSTILPLQSAKYADPSAHTVRPSGGIPKPVPDDQVVDNIEVPTQDQLSVIAPDAPVADLDANIVYNPDQIADEIIPPPGVFTPYDEPPVAVNTVLPIYPDLAARAGIEGTVVMEVAIDKEGQVRDVRVVKASPENSGFEEAAIEAARQTVWKPAISNGLPIPVRITYAIKFRQKGSSE